MVSETAKLTRTDTESKRRVVLFLGSGFSAALDLPTTAQLSTRLLLSSDGSQPATSVEEFISRQIGEFWKTVFGWKPGGRPPTLEDHFTQIDMAANAGHHLGPEYDPRRLRAIRRMTIHRIFSLLKSPGIQDTAILRFLKGLGESFDLTLITTNWDTEAEWALEFLNIPFNYGMREINVKGDDQRGVPVLKLHGSVDRGYCNCCRRIVRFEGVENAVVRLELLLDDRDFDLFDGGAEPARHLRERRSAKHTSFVAMRHCQDCGAPLGMRLATFSYRKDLSAQAFHEVWDAAQTSLQFAEKWIFVGYSLPEADVEIRHLLKFAQLARRRGSEPSVEVVLKCDRQAGERYVRFFGLSDEQVFQGGIHRWIDNRAAGA